MTHHTRTQIETALLAAELAAWNAANKQARAEYRKYPSAFCAACETICARDLCPPCWRREAEWLLGLVDA